MTKQLAIALYSLFDRLWVKSEGVISKEESRALMEAAQFFQNEANVVAVVEPAATQLEGECPNCRQWVVLRSDKPAVDRPAPPKIEPRIFRGNGPDCLGCGKTLAEHLTNYNFCQGLPERTTCSGGE